MTWRSAFVETNGISTHYMMQSSGTPQPIVFIHGFRDNGACLHPAANAVADQRKAITYDIRGHGLSDARPEAYDRATLVNDCVAFCDAVCETPPILYGHSLGAEIAAFVARDIEIDGLVLEAPPAAARKDTSRSTEQEMKDLLMQFREWRVRPHDAIRREYAADDPRFADALATARKQLRPETVGVRQWPYTDLDALLRPLDVQTLVFRADDDSVDYTVPEDAVARQRENVQRHSLSGASHTVLRDEYATVIGHLREFLAANTS